MSKYSSFFPIGLHSHWQKKAANISSLLNDWLFDTNSLTARLVAGCSSFRVELLGQKIVPCPVEEACSTIKEGEDVLVREVLLYCDEQPHVFARSLLPLASLTGEQQNLAQLGEKPLGQIIFNDPSLERKWIEVACFTENSTVGLLVNQLKLTASYPLWGRRSLFYIQAKPLIVAEVFLPPAQAYAAQELFVGE